MYIVHQITGEKIECKIVETSKKDFVFIRRNFSFDWGKEIVHNEVYKLIAVKDNFIHGLISIILKEEYLLLNLIELHKNNIGRNKSHDLVAGNLIAFAARISLEKCEGYMSTFSKSNLIRHYCATYGFKQIGTSNRLISTPENSGKLVYLYYENE